MIVLGAAALAAAWPLTAMRLSPMLLPLLLVGGVVVVIAIGRPPVGVAIALALAPLIDSTVGSGAPAQPLQIMLPGLIVCVAFVAALSRDTRAPHVPLLLSLGAAFLALRRPRACRRSPRRSRSTASWCCARRCSSSTTLRLGARREDRITILAGVLAGLLIAGGQGVLQRCPDWPGRTG